MIGSFLTRGLVLVLGYAYPAYECYKTVEKNKPEIEQLRFWCQYWILVAVLTVCERIGDAFISWVPMYSEAKLAFVVYLWYPKTKGSTYVYDSFFRPYVAKHENEIDRNLLELRTRAGDMAVIYWQRAASYGQTRVFEILRYVSLQSTPRPHPSQPQQNAKVRQPPIPNHQPPIATCPKSEEPPSPTRSTSPTQHQKETSEEVGPLQVPEAAPLAKPTNPQKPTSTVSTSQKVNSSVSSSKTKFFSPLQVPEAAPLAKTTNPQKPTSTVSTSQKVNSSVSSSQKTDSATSNAPKANATSEITSQSRPTEADGMQIDPISSPANESSNPLPKETVMGDGPVTRGRLRRNRSSSKN